MSRRSPSLSVLKFHPRCLCSLFVPALTQPRARCSGHGGHPRAGAGSPVLRPMASFMTSARPASRRSTSERDQCCSTRRIPGAVVASGLHRGRPRDREARDEPFPRSVPRSHSARDFAMPYGAKTQRSPMRLFGRSEEVHRAFRGIRPNPDRVSHSRHTSGLRARGTSAARYPARRSVRYRGAVAFRVASPLARGGGAAHP